MSESFLYYIWQFQYFDKKNLFTTEGEPIQIFNPGMRNGHAGPDFFNARVKIGNMDWIGSVEVHINASNWIDHKHHVDGAYENVVLHVVWKSDKSVKRSDDTQLPTLELRSRVDERLLLNYRKLVNSPESIPCARSFDKVADITRFSMMDKALSARLEEKSNAAIELYRRNNNDWEETCYQILCRNFGFKVNAEPFLQLAQSLPYKVILKHADKLLQVEALLFGQAGFLDDNGPDEYFHILQREYKILSQKYSLRQQRLNKVQWRFLRLRPANFPTVRIAQLAALLHKQKNIFSAIVEKDSHRALAAVFAAKPSAYWHDHYQFFKPADGLTAALGQEAVDNIIINTAAPLLTAYGRIRDEQALTDRTIDILQQIPPESNTITRQWESLGLKAKTAFESQALIGLYNNFCQKHRCLDCNIGSSLIKPLGK